MIDPLRSIGIEKGKPFKPDRATQSVLNAAAIEAHAWLESLYTTVFSQPFFPKTHWALPALPGVMEGMTTSFADPNAYPMDGRGLVYSLAFFCVKHLGAGQFYLMTIMDNAGRNLDGRHTYRLAVPANAPVKQYWSATVYDRATHGLIRKQSRLSRSSQSPGLQTNADGSVDVYFGPKAPAGKQSNWIPTRAGGAFEVLFRLYGPDKSFFDKKWVLPDIERVGARI
jgi:hypothetical protein